MFAAQAAQAFFNEPFECLPLACKQWRLRWSSVAALLAGGIPTVTWSLEIILPGIDDAERSHGGMRGDLWCQSRAK